MRARRRWSGLAARVMVLLAAGALGPADARAAVQEAKLLPADGSAGDRFGANVALFGDTALIGADDNDDGGTSRGSAYVFVRSNGAWTQQAKLLASDGEAWDYFGSSVALHGDTALVGAWGDDDHGNWTGAVYVFERSSDVWTETAKLVPAAGEDHSRFHVVDFDGQTAVIGADADDQAGSNVGAAYIFTREGGVWTEQTKLLPSDGDAVSFFGVSVAISGETVLIGAQNPQTNDQGAAYVFVRSNGVWSEQAKLLPSSGGIIDNFGEDVDLEGDTAVVGSPSAGQAEHVYVFTRLAGAWTETSKLSPAQNGGFGESVALQGDTLIVGLPYDPLNEQRGSASVFVRSEGAWALRAILEPVDGSPIAGFGYHGSIALDADAVLIGSQFADDNGDRSGAAYVFRLGTDTPAVGGVGALLLTLALVGGGAYLARRRR